MDPCPGERVGGGCCIVWGGWCCPAERGSKASGSNYLPRIGVIVEDTGEIPAAVGVLEPVFPRSDTAFWPRDRRCSDFRSGAWVFGTGMNRGRGISGRGTLTSRAGAFDADSGYPAGNDATALPPGGIFASPKALAEEGAAGAREGQPVPLRLLEQEGNLQFKDGPIVDQALVRVGRDCT